MKKRLIILAFILQFVVVQAQNTTYYFIRHSEKIDNSENPDLSEKGKIRAENWNKIFSETKFDAIYSTDFKRTIQTITPILNLRKLKPTIYNPKTIDIELFKNETKNKTVLVVGHSNSTPDFVNKLINEKKYEKIDETVFGNLYIITILENEKAISQFLKLE
jgi:2,3-bisphosphoglycerate-dependent phosphoglycerate mutase